MNRKGDVPTVLLFFVAIGLVLTCLFIFVSFKGTFDSSTSLVEVVYEADFSQQYIVAQAKLIVTDSILHRNQTCVSDYLPIEFSCNAERRDNRVSLTGNFFGKIRNNEFTFEPNDGGYLLSIPGLKVASERGANRIVRTFYLEIRFDTNGEILEEKISPPSSA